MTPSGTPSRSSRLWRWGGIALVTMLLLFFGAVAMVHWRFRAEALEQNLNRELTQRSDSLYTARIGGARLSLLARSYSVTDFQIILDSARLEARTKTGDQPRARYAFRIPAIDIEGIDLTDMVKGDIAIDRISIRDPEIEVSVDRKAKAEPGDTSRVMPHQLLQQSTRRIRVGSLRISDGDVHYSEMARDGARPGKFRFGPLQLGVRNITNDGDFVEARGPSLINLEVMLGGKAKLAAEFEYQLLEPTLTIKYHGGLASSDPRIFNSMLTDLEGVRIGDGRVDTVAFDVTVKDDTARGRLKALYRDLKISTLDKVTRKQDLGDKIASFVSNNFKIRTSNPEGHHGEPPITAKIYLPRRPSMPLLQYLWHTIRQGLGETMGM